MEYYLWKIENEIKKYCGNRKTKENQLNLSSMVRDSFWIEDNIGNNSYGFEVGKKLFCAEIKYSEKFNLEIGKNPVFRDHEENKEYLGLKKNLASHTLNSKTPIFICDNHNLVLEAWQLLKQKKLNLIHIDQHFDNAEFAGISDNWHTSTKICDYIDFAKSAGWINDLLSFVESLDMKKIDNIDALGDVILNIDIDFFVSEMTLISLEDKIKLICRAAKNAKLITIATSPGFIEQELAIKIAGLLFKYL